MRQSPVFCPAREICSNTVNGTMRRGRNDPTYPGRYTVLRSVAKSVALSEGRIRGHPLGDSAVARLA